MEDFPQPPSEEGNQGSPKSGAEKTATLPTDEAEASTVEVPAEDSESKSAPLLRPDQRTLPRALPGSDEKSTPMCLPCGHVYCLGCITEYMRK
eukprot:925847-Pyramimonas_sp.AAC.2